MPDTFVKIATVTVGAGGASSIDFNSIPQTYTDLVIKLSSRVGSGNTYSNAVLSFNGTSTTYRNIRLTGNGSSASSSTITGAAYLYVGEVNGDTSTSNTFGNLEIYIPNYTGSSFKSASSDGVTENNATQAFTALHANLWSDTAAITSMSFQSGGNYLQYTTATLYGIKKD